MVRHTAIQNRRKYTANLAGHHPPNQHARAQRPDTPKGAGAGAGAGPGPGAGAGGDGAAVYAGVLNGRGRFLHDLVLFGAGSVERRLGLPAGSAGGDEAVLADVPAWSAGALVRLLRMYRLRRPVEVDDVSADFTVWQLCPPEDGAAAPRPAAAGAAAWFPDPRLPALGFRALVPAGEVPPGGAAGGGDCGGFQALRYALGVAEGDREMPSGEALPLECNLDALNGVSYKKGCYVGQELTARTHFKGVIRKRLMPVTLSGGGASPGDAVRLAGGGRRVGKLLAADDGGRGLALLRLRPVLEAAARGESCVVEGSGALLAARRPEWWPGGWGHEEDG